LSTRENKKTWANVLRPKSIITVDASTNSLAFAYFKEGKLNKYGKIGFIGTDALYKAGDACKKASNLFQSISADALVIESAIYSNSPKTAINLSIMQGSIIGAAQVAGIPVVKSISPMQWQSYVGTRLLTAEEKQAIVKKYPGKSKSWYKNKERETRKNKTIESVNKNFHVKVSDNDVADAIGIGWFVNDRWSVVFDGQ
jgi:Holliday junction resolvasome RuvABC endonuclease subunit